MGVREIYLKAVQSVIDGNMKPEELYELFEEHLSNKQIEYDRVSKALENVNKKYTALLSNVAKAYEDFKKSAG